MQWLAVEGVRDTGRAEAVYNGRVAEYHTYFVGCDEWGFSLWAHNSCGPTARTVNHFDKIARFRQRAGLPAFDAADSATGTVARAVVNDGTGRAYHGVNTGLSSNSILSRMEVLQQLQTRGYFRNVTNIGQAPMLAHAEAHALMRAVERTGARSITIYSDRTVCRACRTQLHLLARHLGVTELRVFEAGNPLPYIIMPRP